MSKESRETLFVLAVIAWIVLLQAPYLPAWSLVWAGLVLLWRARIAWYGRPIPSRLWTRLALGVAVGGIYLQHGTLIGKEAGVGLIILLLVTKTLELKAQRDATVLFFLGFFALITQFFYSQSLATALGIGVAVWGLMTALIYGQRLAGSPKLSASARQAAHLALWAAPVMAVLFLLFPRLPPLWGHNGQGMLGRTGLSEQMRVGDVAALATDDRIALRLRFLDASPPPDSLYFRGPVLSAFDGRHWTPASPSFAAGHRVQAELLTQGPGLRYEVLLEPHRQRWLPTLEATAEAPDGSHLMPKMNAELRWLNALAVTEPVRYQATAHLRHRHGPTTAVLGLQDYLDLPPGFNPQTLALAQRMARELGDTPNRTIALVEQALSTLRTGGYSYSLSPGVFGQHTADEVWFERKVGFCEHYASAFVVLMRALDIPARVVTGYQGAAFNPTDGYWVIRQRDAHAWAEVWVPDQGWIRTDPTAAVAQWRTHSAVRLSTPSTLESAVHALYPALGMTLQRWWEAADTRWTLWVLDYTQLRQLGWLQRWGWRDASLPDLWGVLGMALSMASMTGLAWVLWRSRSLPTEPWAQMLQLARERMVRCGVALPAHPSPADMAAAWRLHIGLSEAESDVMVWLHHMEVVRYGRSPTLTLPALRRRFRQLNWPRTPS